MKMRKKLAALLAAAMIASVMPMTAFAASDNRVTKTVAVAKGELKGSAAPQLVIKLKDELATNQAFYLNLTGGEWLEATYGEANKASGIKTFAVTDAKGAGTEILVTRTGAKALRVEANDGSFLADTVFAIALDADLDGGEATVEIDGADTVIDSGKYVFATSSDDAKATIIVADPSSFAEKGKIAKITFEEPYINAFKKATSVTGDNEIKIELRDNDFEFVSGGKVDKLRGFAVSGVATVGTPVISGRDNDVLTITLPDTTSATQRGAFELKDVEIRRTSRDAAKGEVKASISGKLIDGTQTVVLAKYGDHTTKLEDTAKETKEVLAGNSVDVEFKLSEEIANSLLGNRAVDFELSKDIKFKAGSVKVNKVKDVDAAETKDTATGRISMEKDFNTFVVDGFNTDVTKKAEYTFEATLLVPNSYDKDEITLTATGKALSDTHEIVIAKVEKPVTVEVTPVDIKVGLKAQVGGKIVITENVKEAIKKSTKVLTREYVAGVVTERESNSDAYLEVRLADRDAGLKIKDADIEVTKGDLVLDLDDKYISDGMIAIRIKRQSTEPSTIEITNIEITADRTVPEGKYDIKVGGSALSANTSRYEFDERALRDEIYVEDTRNSANTGDLIVTFFDPVVAEDFINITTKNTEDGATKTGAEVVSFVIGNNKFIADGKEIEMDAAPYIKDGRTMVPVRYLATALGVDSESIKFNAGVVTIFKADGKVIQLTVGSKNLVVNGMTIPMVAAAEIVEGRTYVPVTEIGGIFGVAGTWDAATQTATFQ